MSILHAEKKPKKHSEHKPKKEKGVDEIDVGKVVIPNKAAVEDDGEQQPQAKQVYPLGQSQPVSEKKTDSQPQAKPVYPPPGRLQPTSERKADSQSQTKPVSPLGQTQPVGEKKADLQKLPQTPTTSMEKQQPPAPPAPQKKVYPKEKHPKAAESPKFGQRLLAAPPGKKKPSVKPEPVVKPSEQKRIETKPPEVTKPVEKVFSPHRKAPEPPIERASPKPKAKVTARAYYM